MSVQIIKVDRSDAKNIIEDLKYNWIKYVLESMQPGGASDLSDFFADKFEEQTLNQKAKLRNFLKQNDIYIDDSLDGECLIYVQNELIAGWKKPLYKLCIDHKEKDPSKKYYYSVTLEYASAMDQEYQGE